MIFSPFFNYILLVYLHYLNSLLQVFRFYTLILYNIQSLDIYLRPSISVLNMHVDWQVLKRMKKNLIPNNSNSVGIVSRIKYYANVGINFYPRKSFEDFFTYKKLYVKKPLSRLPLQRGSNDSGMAHFGLRYFAQLRSKYKGGLAYSATYAMVGDNPNAAVDPEVIAPLSKLKTILESN